MGVGWAVADAQGIEADAGAVRGDLEWFGAAADHASVGGAEVRDGFVAKAWLANAGALAGVNIVEVVFVIPITMHIAAGLLQQIQSVTVEPWGKFIRRIQIVSEYLGEESFRLIGCFVSLVLSRCCGMELKGERSES